MNTYSSLALRSMGGNGLHCKQPRPAARPATRPQDGLDSLVDDTLVFAQDDGSDSDDCARDTSISSARGGSGGFASARSGFGGSARGGFGGFGGGRDSRPLSPSPAAHGAARGGFGSRSTNGDPSPTPAARGGAARGSDARTHSDHDGGRQWNQTDFPTEEALHKCKVKRHEDLPRHIYLLLDILGLQFRCLLTRMGKGRALVSSEDLDVTDHKERTWMAMYTNDRDVIEHLLYCRLKFLWTDCTDAMAVFACHRVQEEFCAQKVWEALLTAFPLNHKRMQTVLLAREFGRLMAWDGHSKADVDRHFGNVKRHTGNTEVPRPQP